MIANAAAAVVCSVVGGTASDEAFVASGFRLWGKLPIRLRIAASRRRLVRAPLRLPPPASPPAPAGPPLVPAPAVASPAPLVRRPARSLFLKVIGENLITLDIDFLRNRISN